MNVLTPRPALALDRRAAGPVSVPRVQDGPESGRCLVVGVINVTPDSFSDEGKSFHPEWAIERGVDLMRLGADIIEVGSRYPRPGAAPVPLAEERRRVIPVVAALAEAGGFISISTMRSRVAEDAVRAGARMVADPSGGLADPGMLRFAAASKLPYIVTLEPGRSSDLRLRTLNSVIPEMIAGLTSRIAAATRAGITFERLVVDPGLDFASTNEHYWGLLLQVQAFHQLGCPVLVGAPRRPLSGGPLPGPVRLEYAAGRREGVSAAIAVFAASAGAWGVRTHDAGPALDGVRVAAGLRDG